MKLFGRGQTCLSAVCDGSIKKLENVGDEVFSSGIMGAGVAIEPQNGNIYAPCEATVTSIADTSHALTLRTPDGIDVLIHVGINTVELKGKGFEVKCEEGARVKQGDLLVVADIGAIREAGYDPCVIIVMPDNGALKTDILQSGKVTKESTVIKIKK